MYRMSEGVMSSSSHPSPSAYLYFFILESYAHGTMTPLSVAVLLIISQVPD